MKDELEPLKYSTLVPGRYVVYVHPREFERIRNYTDILREETARALDEELARLNRAPIWRQYLEPVLGGGKAYRNPLGDWQIEFHEDPDGDLAEGDVMIEADVIVKEDEPGDGQRTRRVTTFHADGGTNESAVCASNPPAAERSAKGTTIVPASLDTDASETSALMEALVTLPSRNRAAPLRLPVPDVTSGTGKTCSPTQSLPAQEPLATENLPAMISEVPGVGAVADDEQLDEAEQRLGVAVAGVVLVFDDLLHGPSRIHAQGF